MELVSQKRAREIMGKNFLGVEGAVKYFRLNPVFQLAVISEIPFSEEVLEQLKDTHILVAVFPLSILEVRGIHSNLFDNQSWYNRELFAKESSKFSWQLVCKTPVVDNSMSEGWRKQLVFISNNDEIPTAQVMAYTIIGHYLATGERLFENACVRTSNVLSDDYIVGVGRFDPRGLFINHYYNDIRDRDIGIATARKFSE
jgi:hypothetical protein